jgi:hypothetical protein
VAILCAPFFLAGGKMKNSKFALIAAAVASFCAPVYAKSVDVNFTVTGQAGNWVVDFSFTNNLSSAASLYLLGVKTDGVFVGAPSPYIRSFAGGANIGTWGDSSTWYPIAWLDLTALNGSQAGQGLRPGQTLSGFKIRTSAIAEPTSFEWFAQTRGAVVTEVFDFGSASAAGFKGTATVAAAVPEPETYALMLVGLGVLGSLARRRSQTQGGAGFNAG